MSSKISFFGSSSSISNDKNNTTLNNNSETIKCLEDSDYSNSKCATHKIANIDFLKTKEEVVGKSTIKNLRIEESTVCESDFTTEGNLTVDGETCLNDILTIKAPTCSDLLGETVITYNSLDISNIISINSAVLNNMKVCIDVDFYEDVSINGNLIVYGDLSNPRITQLETENTDLKAKVATLETTITNIQARLTVLEGYHP